jgi:hypothetical protein
MGYREKMIGRMYYKAKSDYDAAKGSLDLLLDHPAGIGDHSTDDLYKSYDEALDLLVDANDRLEMLNSEYFKDWEHSDSWNPPHNPHTHISAGVPRTDIGE